MENEKKLSEKFVDYKKQKDTSKNVKINISKQSSPNPLPVKNKISIWQKSKNFFTIFSVKKSTIDKVHEELKKSDKIDQKKKDIEEKKYQSNLELLRRKNLRAKIKVSRYERRKKLKEYLLKSGYNITDETSISKKMMFSSIFLVFLMSLYLLYAGIVREDRIFFVITQILVTWLIILPAVIVLLWAIFYFVIDFKIYNRTKELEEVLPDFLQLTSANINAGMPLDQALWYAVRPRFGILAKEIEEVAKSTLVGEELKDALMKFSQKYDSVILKRTINLILEGLESGGEIGSLMNKIAIDIQETRIIRKDMAANVTTYVIFISFATLVAAPFLFALSNQLLVIIQSLISNINIPQGTGGGALSSISFSGDSISLKDFKIFAVSALTVTSFFSAVIVSIIQKGNVRDGIKYIPIFILTSVILFFVASKILGFFLGGLI